MPTLCFEMLLNHRNGCSGFSALPAQFRVSCKLRPNVRRKGCHTAVDAVLSELSPYRVQSKVSKACMRSRYNLSYLYCIDAWSQACAELESRAGQEKHSHRTARREGGPKSAFPVFKMSSSIYPEIPQCSDAITG